MMYSTEYLKAIALKLINAMIFDGPENEQQLHLLLILLDTEPDDDIANAINEADQYIINVGKELDNLLDNLNK